MSDQPNQVVNNNFSRATLHDHTTGVAFNANVDTVNNYTIPKISCLADDDNHKYLSSFFLSLHAKIILWGWIALVFTLFLVELFKPKWVITTFEYRWYFLMLTTLVVFICIYMLEKAYRKWKTDFTIKQMILFLAIYSSICIYILFV